MARLQFPPAPILGQGRNRVSAKLIQTKSAMMRMINRLSQATSPYLKQHSTNPVNWHPWGEEAFEEARRLDRPIFLSIGYSSCHWCHVMEHESFVDPEIASILNRSFVSIKVDREERPDLDDGFLTFVQMLTGRGGWPMSVFLMPDKSPFFGGTYFPKDDRGEIRGFLSILLSLERLWVEKRGELAEAAEYYSVGIREALAEQSTPTREFSAGIPMLLQTLRSNFDPKHGGFSRAPKFPPHSALQLLLKLDPSDPMAVATLTELARGGIHDHVGGGFHRYSTDGEWRLPHFEKMLYDNALLLKSFSEASPNELFVSCGKGIVSWLKSEMLSPDGLFYSALDADSDGQEGKFYVWKYREILELPNGKEVADAYQCHTAGNFHDEATGLLTGENVLHLAPGAERFAEDLALLRARRAERIRPMLDDKCLVGWNGLAISGLVSASEVGLAHRCAEAILIRCGASGDLPRYISEGVSVGTGFLEDYAYFGLGLFDLAQFRPELSSPAAEIGQKMIDRFYDPEHGGFFGTSPSDEMLFGRTKPVFDQPIPSPNSAAIRVLIRMGELELAKKSIESFGGWMQRAPMACEGLFLAQWELSSLQGGKVVVAGAKFEIGDVTYHKELTMFRVYATIPTTWQLNPMDGKGKIRVIVNESEFEAQEPQPGPGRHYFPVRIPQLVKASTVKIVFQLCTEDRCLPRESVEISFPTEPSARF